MTLPEECPSDALLCEWKHSAESVRATRRSSFHEEGRASSEPALLDWSRKEEGEDSLWNRIGSSIGNLFAEETTTQPKPAIQPIPSRNMLRIEESFEEEDKEEDLGVVTYMGKEYSARDLFERCNSSRGGSNRSLHSSSAHNSISSLANDNDESESGGRVGRLLVRGLSSLNVAVGAGKPETRSMRSVSPMRRQRCRSPLPRTRSWHSLSDKKIDAHLDKLQVDNQDVLAITENPKDFAALKQTLKDNKAITNGLLQQGFHVFVHQQKKQKEEQLRRQRRAKERARSRSPTRITRPTRTEAAISA